MSTGSEGLELGSAYIKLTLRRDELTKQLREVETDIKQAGAKAENESGGGGLMSKYLFGRLGPQGVGDSVEHAMGHAAFGRMFRTFAAGGVIGVGIGMIAHHLVDFGREWYRAATGAEAYEKALEKATESQKEFASAVAATDKARESWEKGIEKPSGTKELEEVLHPRTGERKDIGRMGELDEAQKLRKEFEAKAHEQVDAGNKDAQRFNEMTKGLTITNKDEFLAKIAAAQEAKAATLEEADHPTRKLTRVEMGDGRFPTFMGGTASQRQKKLDEGNFVGGFRPDSELTAAELEKRKNMLLGLHSATHVGGQVLSNVLPGLESMGRAGFNTIEGMTGGALGRTAHTAGEIGHEAMEGGRLRAEAGQHISDMRKHFARRKEDYEAEKQYGSAHGAADVADIGKQIQAALLEPNPFEKEGRELDRQIVAVNKDLVIALRNLNPALKRQTDIHNATFTD